MTPKKPDSRAAAGWIVGGVEELKNQTPAQRGMVRPPEEKAKAVPSRKRFTVNLDLELIERARITVANTLGLTLTGLVEDALRKELAKMEKERGGAISGNVSAPKKGRPVVIKG